MIRKLKLTRDKSEVSSCGNRLIEMFMAGMKPKFFDDNINSEYIQYESSWDLMMTVVHKIKEKVYEKGYDLFLSQHFSYIKIGNALYDADIWQVWEACVFWITIRFEVSGIDTMANTEEKKPKNIVYKTTESLRLTPHAVRRYRQRINDTTPITDIFERLCNERLLVSYKLNGNGVYYIGNMLHVVIDNFKITTVYKTEIEGAHEINIKIRELNKNEDL